MLNIYTIVYCKGNLGKFLMMIMLIGFQLECELSIEQNIQNTLLLCFVFGKFHNILQPIQNHCCVRNCENGLFACHHHKTLCFIGITKMGLNRVLFIGNDFFLDIQRDHKFLCFSE